MLTEKMSIKQRHHHAVISCQVVHAYQPHTRTLSMRFVVAGTVTTFRTTHSFVAIITNYPELQKKLQGVIDEAIGTRQPRLDDMEKIPYLHAVSSAWTRAAVN